MTSGLRERKKQATRQAISDMATLMFERDGFDGVSIAQVAAEAGVSKMTVTNYFPRKEDLVFDRAEFVIKGLAAAVARRPTGERVLAAVRRDYLDAVAKRSPIVGFSRVTFARMFEASPVLQARMREMLDQRERTLADLLRDSLPLDDVMAQFYAAQLGTVQRILATEARHRVIAGVPPDELEQFLRESATAMFDLLELGP